MATEIFYQPQYITASNSAFAFITNQIGTG